MRSRKPGAKRSIWRSIASVMSRVEPDGHVAVGPADVLALRRAARVADRRLGEQHVGPLGVAAGVAAASLAAISSNVPPTCTVPARAQSGAVHGIGPSSAQSSLKTPGAVAVALERAAVAVRQPVAGERRRTWRGREVEQHGARVVELVDALDAVPGDDLRAVGARERGERVGHRLRAAARDRPADVVAGEHEHERDRGGRRAVEPQHRVRRVPGDQRPRARLVEAAREATWPRAGRAGRSASGRAGGGSAAAGRGSPAAASRRRARAGATSLR